MRPLRICIIGSSRFPIREPFAGGLEAHTHALARRLSARGHEVTLFAAPGSDPALGAEELAVEQMEPVDGERADTSIPPHWWMQEHHAYQGLMLDADARGARALRRHPQQQHPPPAGRDGRRACRCRW